MLNEQEQQIKVRPKILDNPGDDTEIEFPEDPQEEQPKEEEKTPLITVPGQGRMYELRAWRKFQDGQELEVCSTGLTVGEAAQLFEFGYNKMVCTQTPTPPKEQLPPHIG